MSGIIEYRESSSSIMQWEQQGEKKWRLVAAWMQNYPAHTNHDSSAALLSRKLGPMYLGAVWVKGYVSRRITEQIWICYEILIGSTAPNIDCSSPTASSARIAIAMTLEVAKEQKATTASKEGSKLKNSWNILDAHRTSNKKKRRKRGKEAITTSPNMKHSHSRATAWTIICLHAFKAN